MSTFETSFDATFWVPPLVSEDSGGRAVPKLPTAQETYNRIHWDPGFDERRFTIGIASRTRPDGIEEVSFTDFVPGGEIPWHRIRYFRCADVVVWDRRTKTVLLDPSRQSP